MRHGKACPSNSIAVPEYANTLVEAITLLKDGKLTPLSKTEIKTINEDIKRRNLLPMFEQVKSDYEEWNDSLVDVMKATGIINEELARVFKKYGDYIPCYRNMDMDA